MSRSAKQALSSLLSLAVFAGSIPPAVAADMKAAAGKPAAAAALPASALKLSAGTVPNPAKVPVKVELAPEVLQAMTPAQRANVAALSKLAEASLFTNDKVDVALPGTIFDNSGESPIIGAGDLFQAPQANELERLAIKLGKLDAGMHAQLKRTGTFDVASEDFPGQTHTWKTAGLIQQGSEVSRELRRARLSSAAEQYLSSLPRTINGGTALSLDRTLKNFFSGLYETAGLALGVPETHNAHDQYSIEQARLKNLSNDIKDALPSRDLALYDAELMQKASPILARIQERANDAWSAKAEAVAEELGKTIKDPQQLADALARARQDELYAGLKNDTELEAVHAGLGALVTARLKFKQSVAETDAAYGADIAAAAAKHEANLRAEHPILSRVSGWTESRVAAFRAEFAAGLEPLRADAIAKAAAAHGLAPEHAVEAKFAAFWAGVRERMLAMRAANRTFSYGYEIWDSKNWKVVRHDDGTYSGSQQTVVERDTMQPFWRLSNLAQRYMSLTNNMLHGLLKDTRFPIGGLVYGPLGWKALFAKEAFAYNYQLDYQTGKWQATAARRNTYRSRLSGFYAQRRQILDEHARKPSHATFLGKGFFRWTVLFLYADLGLGLVAPIVVGVLQPILTVANTVLSLALAAATPFVLAPAMSLFVSAYQALIFDNAGTAYARWRPSIKGAMGMLGTALVLGAAWYFGPKFGVDFLSGYWLAGLLAVIVAQGPLFPWVGTLLKKAGLYGAAFTVLSAAKALFHVVAGPVIAALSGALWLGRRTWDNVVMQPILRWRASVPSESGRFVKRVAGPGLTSEYFFQVSEDLPLLAAWASMESSELHRYEAEMKDVIARPVKAYEEFSAVLDALTAGDNRGRPQSPAYKLIGEKHEAESKTLSEAIEPRAVLYSKLLQVPHQDRVKLARTDLESLLKKTAVLAQKFYGEVMAQQKWSAEKTAAFWKSRGLKADDWVGLAKTIQAGIFGANVLAPFEDSDKTLRIKVSAPHAGDYVKGLESGIMPGELDKVSVDLGQTAAPQGPRVESRVPVVTTNDLGGGLL